MSRRNFTVRSNFRRMFAIKEAKRRNRYFRLSMFIYAGIYVSFHPFALIMSLFFALLCLLTFYLNHRLSSQKEASPIIRLLLSWSVSVFRCKIKLSLVIVWEGCYSHLSPPPPRLMYLICYTWGVVLVTDTSVLNGPMRLRQNQLMEMRQGKDKHTISK